MKNGWDLSELEAFEKGLDRLGDQLGDGSALFATHRARYLAMAKHASMQFLLGAPSDKVDRETWAERADDFVDLIFAEQAGNAPSKQNKEINYDDVLRWVEAGPENGGKDKTAIETNRGRSDEQIAYDVYTAIRQYRLGIPGDIDYGPITERLERWIDFGESANYFLEKLPDLLEVWTNLLVPVMERDLSDWADDLLADL
jgi:hypothetical protein